MLLLQQIYLLRGEARVIEVLSYGDWLLTINGRHKYSGTGMMSNATNQRIHIFPYRKGNRKAVFDGKISNSNESETCHLMLLVPRRFLE